MVCQRRRSTLNKVKIIGVVLHGYATGHKWECIDEDECTKYCLERVAKINDIRSEIISMALKKYRGVSITKNKPL